MKVYDYDISGSNHCREGVAIESGDYLIDTYWGSGSDNHYLSDEERATATLRFDTDEFEEIDRYKRTAPTAWTERHPDDRNTIPSQHGLQHRWFIRKGSEPDFDTRLANAERALADAEERLRSAEFAVKHARADVETIRAERPAPVPEAKVGPHSRACGARKHDHGADCHSNCPSCEGKTSE